VFPTKNVVTSDPNAARFTLSFPKDLTYTITAKAQTPEGLAVVTKQVPVSRTALASFNASLNATGVPNELVLTNYSLHSNKFYWLFSDSPLRDSATSTVKNYMKGGAYSVTLVAIGLKGCNDTLGYSFRIDTASSLVLPNIFSPNRDDVNDVFKPITKGISSLRGWIYNRDGTLMYQWDTVNGFWDGRTTSGEVCVDGQYIVIVEAKGFDGKSYNLRGPLTIVR
jgi:hypothetical protein